MASIDKSTKSDWGAGLFVKPSEVVQAKARSRWRFSTVVAAVAGILLIAGFWADHAVEEAMDDAAASVLTTVLEADLAALELWARNERETARLIAEDPEIRLATEGLLAEVPDNRGELDSILLRSVHLMRLREALGVVGRKAGYQGFLLVRKDGLVLAAGRDEMVGATLQGWLLDLKDQVFQGQSLLPRPFRGEEGLRIREGAAAEVIMAVVVPVKADEGATVAALALRIRPEDEFSRILSVARVGRSGDTYAFDENGLMLSQSRHDEQLRALGLLPPAPGATSVLTVALRDPGGDRTRGFVPTRPAGQLPPTKLLSAAVGAAPGIHLILDRYRDYRGVPVIGAYRWFPEMAMGIATEAEVAELERIVRPLRFTLFGLFGLVVTGALAFVVVALVNYRLQSRVREIQRLGKYTLERKIGEGGMGKVYLARHALLKRPTAVKFLDPEKVDRVSVARFEREVQMTSRLTHPNTVEVYDYGHTPEGIFYYAMEYIDGLDLADLIVCEGVVPSARVVYILRQVCSSLEEAHGAGFVHRDIKPMNIMLCERGGEWDVAKVLDFGLVKELEEAQETGVTSAQVVPGTPAYVAPERLADPLRADARVDIYSVGAVAFNLLTGREVFEGTSGMEIAFRALKTPPPRPAAIAPQGIPEALDLLVHACLAKDPMERPQSARQIIAALDSIEGLEPWGQTQARAWWERYRERTGRARDETAPAGGKT